MLWHFIKTKRDNARHRVSMLAAICAKCDEFEDLDKYDHVAAKVLKQEYVERDKALGEVKCSVEI